MAAFPQPEFRNIDSSIAIKTLKQNPVSLNSSTTTNHKDLRKTTKLVGKRPSSATLQLLIWLQKGSSCVAAVTVLSSISIYITTVRIPQMWTQEYENLQELQLQERQLVVVNESLKYEIAQKAQQSKSEMSNISPENTIFLKPNSVAPQPKEEVSSENDPWQSIPLGY
jgi:hypothetical protein